MLKEIASSVTIERGYPESKHFTARITFAQMDLGFASTLPTRKNKLMAPIWPSVHHY
jgi:hypothetical protein